MESQTSPNAEASQGDGGDPQRQLADLQTKLKEKETLVAALTGRLEQAAEQLDRLRRMGADRGNRTVAGVPPELIEEQRELTAQLQVAVNEWQEANAAAALSRIEVQVAEIRDIVSGFSGGVPAHSGGGLAGALFEHAARKESTSSESHDAHGGDQGQEGSELQGWEALKASMMTDSGEAPEASHASHGGQAATGGAPAEYVAPLEPPEEIPEEDPPEPIDFDTADVEQLQAAVEARDAYISHLLRRLKNAVSYRMPPVDWRALENVPEDLQAKLGDLEQQLQEKLRITEVELSLERARMAREASRINQLNAQVQKHLERGGIAPGGADDDDLPEEKKGRRWLSMLGLNHEDED